MRGVIRGDHAHRAVENSLDKRVSVFFTTKRRIHLEATVLLQILVAEHEIMRTGLTGDIHTFGTGTAYDVHAFLRGNVAHVIAYARFLRNLHVAGNLTPLTFGADAAVPVSTGIFSVVNPAAPKQRIHLAMRGNDLTELL